MPLIAPLLTIAALVVMAAWAGFTAVAGIGAVAEAERAGEDDVVVGGILLEALAWAAGALACAAIAGFIAGRL